jgi:polyketide synthase 13
MEQSFEQTSAGKHASPARSAEEVQQWIVVRLARLLQVETAEIDPAAPLAHHGLDSVQFVLFVTDLEQWLGLTFKKNPVNEQSTIASLAEHLASLTRQA